jgi:hypothetical protein
MRGFFTNIVTLLVVAAAVMLGVAVSASAQQVQAAPIERAAP